MMAPDPVETRRARIRKRFERQLNALERSSPRFAGPFRAIRARGWWIVRLPLGLIFIAGGFLAFLPVLGLWMIPLGLLILAIDLPLLREPVSNAIVRWRRRITVWRRGGRKR